MARKCALLTLLVACAVARAAATGVTAAPFHSDRAGERASGSGSGLAAAAPVLPVVEAWAANSVRVRWPAPGYPLAESPYSPYAPQPPGAPAAVRAGDTFTNGNLAVDVSAAGLVTARRVSDGLTLLSQVSLEFGAPVLPGLPPSVEATFAGAATSEIFVGAGEQGLAGHAVLEMPFMRDFADTEYYGYNHGSQAFLPLFFSSAGYGVMVAQQGYGHLTLSRAPDVTAFNATAARVFDMWITTTPGTPVFAAGVPHPTLALLSNYADAVGHAPPVPGFATGFVASKDRYRNQTQFLDVVHGYLDRAIPLSVATIDWFHWAELGDMSLKKECWPDPVGMAEEMRGLGVELMITHWPFMSTASVHRAAFEAAGALAINVSSGTPDMFWQYLQNGSLITTFSNATSSLVDATWGAGYGALGIKAVWLDETEPDRTGPADAMLRVGGWSYEGVNDLELGPTWRQQWLRTMTGALERRHGLGNYFLLSRSAWLGTAKYGHFVWSGDTDSSWKSFRLQVSTGVSAGLSGIGGWTSDLGGYNPTMQPFDPSLEELLVRWAQFASVSPVMRLHGHRNGGPPSDPVCMQTNGDNEPWTLFKGAESSPNYAAMVASIRWREQHRNYVADALSAWAATGEPVLAPVWLRFPADAVCAPGGPADDGACGDAFMFGEDFLAKPVTEYGAATSWVWLPALPAGEAWQHAFTGATFEGGQNVTVATPIDSFPLFQRVPAV